jgi:hypothetical protein
MLMYLYSKSNKQKNLGKENNFLLASRRSLTKKTRSGSFSQWFGSADPDPDGTKMLRIHKGWLLFLDADGVRIKHLQPASSEVH